MQYKGTPVYDAVVALVPRAVRDAVPSHLVTWQAGVTPLSTLPSIGSVIACYLAVIFGLQAFMRSRKAFGSEPWFKAVFIAHNIALTLGSGLLLACMAEEIIPILRQRGFFYAICGQGAWTLRMETFYIINYFFKFWELLDTVFLAAKKKPLQFLHVYHHSATALLCYSQLHGHTSVSWVVITLNLFVHVWMYLYYTLSAMKIRVPWKRQVTVMQVVQFIIDLFVVFYASYSYGAATYAPWLPHQGTCAGEEYAAWAGCACLSSYLFLFIGFYKKTYNKKQAAAAASAQANGNGNGNGKAVAAKGKKSQ